MRKDSYDFDKATWIAMWIAILLVVIYLVLDHYLIMFEDGSWGLGEFPYVLKGCLPWGICE